MKTLMLSTLTLAGLAGGCVVHDHGPYHHPHYGSAVVIESGHVHSDSCGHFRHGDHWYYAREHRHGPGCGHVYRGGMWIVVD